MTDKYRLVLKGEPVSREEAERIRKLAVAAPDLRDACRAVLISGCITDSALENQLRDALEEAGVT
jgi:hypothetical protein